MTRGKQAIASANRRARAAVETDLATYQRKVVDLTRERDELRDQLAKVRVESAELIRQLKVERDEGIGPTTAALRLKLDQARIDQQQLRASIGREFALIARKYDIQFGRKHAGAVTDALVALFGAEWLDLTTRMQRRNAVRGTAKNSDGIRDSKRPAVGNGLTAQESRDIEMIRSRGG